MLLQIVFLALFLHFGSPEYYSCPNVQTNGYVVDIKVGDCDARKKVCRMTNSSNMPFELDFLSIIPAQSLIYHVIVRQNGKDLPMTINVKEPCDIVKCPVQVGQINKYKAIGSIAPDQVENGLIVFYAKMTNEQGEVIFCVLNGVLIDN